MATTRVVSETPAWQGNDESIAYVFDWSNVGTPTSPECTLTDILGQTDLSSTNLSGSASVSGDNVTSPLVTALSAGVQYRLTCTVTISGNTFSSYQVIICER